MFHHVTKGVDFSHQQSGGDVCVSFSCFIRYQDPLYNMSTLGHPAHTLHQGEM